MYKKSKKLKIIREIIEKGSGVYNACKTAGISPVTLWMWRKKDNRVERYITALMDHRISLVEDALYKGAITGNTVAQIFFLKNRAGDKWADKQERETTVTVKLPKEDIPKRENRIAEYLDSESIRN